MSNGTVFQFILCHLLANSSARSKPVGNFSADWLGFDACVWETSAIRKRCLYHMVKMTTYPRCHLKDRHRIQDFTYFQIWPSSTYQIRYGRWCSFCITVSHSYYIQTHLCFQSEYIPLYSIMTSAYHLSDILTNFSASASSTFLIFTNATESAFGVNF